MAWVASAPSITWRQIGPVLAVRARVGDPGWIQGIRPGVDTMPKTPEYADGSRVEPPPSEPRPIGTRRAQTAAAVPELDHPGTRERSQGLRASTSQLYIRLGSVAATSTREPEPIRVLVPTMIAPAARSRSTCTSSRGAAGMFCRVFMSKIGHPF